MLSSYFLSFPIHIVGDLPYCGVCTTLESKKHSAAIIFL